MRDDSPPALSWETVEQRLWEDPFRCANIECCDELGHDHVTLITTTQVRRFCSVDCIAAGQRADKLATGQHARLQNRLTFDALELGDEPTDEHFRVRDQHASLWQRALSLHRHRCEPEAVRDEDALIDAARRCDMCMFDASRGLGFSVV
ncbi:hypothetical protein [Actinophytocola sp.]|uniref:hypothetical protein n=1 Tax=Actinophytocola sp. TaxID=1872138 RepID=UPI002ECFDC66